MTKIGLEPLRRGAAIVLTLALVLLLGACSSLPVVDRATIASEAIPLSTQTTLGRIAKGSTPAPELSGFRLMPLGLFSLDTRVQLARRARSRSTSSTTTSRTTRPAAGCCARCAMRRCAACACGC